MLFYQQPPAHVEPQQKQSVQQSPTAGNSPNVAAGANGAATLTVTAQEKERNRASAVGARTAVAVLLRNNGATMPADFADSPAVTGLWMDQRGLVATCSSGLPSSTLGLTVVTIQHSPQDDENAVIGPAMYREVIRLKQDGGLSILQIKGVDSQAAIPASESEQGRPGTDDGTQSAPLSSWLPYPGEPVFLVAVERGENPKLTTIDGMVLKIESVGKEKRIRAKFPFKSSYCGAPILTGRGEVVGIVEKASEDSGEIVAIPSRYLVRLRQTADLPTVTSARH